MANNKLKMKQATDNFMSIAYMLIISGFLIFLGQRLFWQLNRTDCGSYTVNEDKSGDIPLQCKSAK